MTEDAIARRLERLERENRWMKRIGLVVLLMIVTTGVSASRFVAFSDVQVNDSAGKTRINMRVGNTSNMAFMGFLDSAAKTRVYIGQTTGGNPTLQLYDTAGKARLVLFSDLKTGTPFLRLLDAAGRTRLQLGTKENGEGFIQFFGERQNDTRIITK